VVIIERKDKIVDQQRVFSIFSLTFRNLFGFLHFDRRSQFTIYLFLKFKAWIWHCPNPQNIITQSN
jgi:hypothetical protein